MSDKRDLKADLDEFWEIYNDLTTNTALVDFSLSVIPESIHRAIIAEKRVTELEGQLDATCTTVNQYVTPYYDKSNRVAELEKENNVLKDAIYNTKAYFDAFRHVSESDHRKTYHILAKAVGYIIANNALKGSDTK